MMDSAVGFTMIILRLNMFQKSQMSRTITRSQEESLLHFFTLLFLVNESAPELNDVHSFYCASAEVHEKQRDFCAMKSNSMYLINHVRLVYDD